MSTKNNISVVLIGYGYWGQNLLRNLTANPAFDVKSVIDLDGSKGDYVRRAYPGIPFNGSVAEALQRSDIEAVVIATPVRTHFELAKLALLAGKHVLLEKPATVTTRQADDLIKLARDQARMCLVDHTYLFTPAIRHMKKLIDSGEIGAIRYIDSVRINLGIVRSDVNVLWDLAVHDISIALYLLNERPRSVRASAGVKMRNGMENVGYLTLLYPGDTMVHVSCSWASPVKLRHMLVSGVRRTVLFNDLEPTEKVKIYDANCNVPRGEERRTAMVDHRVGDIFIPKLSKEEALAAVCDEFAACIRAPRTSCIDLSQAKATVSVLAAAQVSLEERGEEVSVTWES